MAGRTADQARTAFIALTQRALSCLSDAVVYYRAAPVGQAEILIVSEDPLRLPRDAGAALQLTLDQQYTLVNEGDSREAWKVFTRGYRYQLSDDAGREIAAWHCTRTDAAENGVRTSTSRTGRSLVCICRRARLASSRSSRLLLTELGVRSRRSDWGQVLAEVDDGFRA